VRAIGIVATTIEINQLFEKIDYDRDGTVTMQELQRELDMIFPHKHAIAPAEVEVADAVADQSAEFRTPAIAAKAAGTQTRGFKAGQTVPVDEAVPKPRPASPPTNLTKQGKKIRKRATLAVRHDYRAVAELDLDRGRIWAFKVFHLFPILKYLSHLDFVFRVVFPIAYLANVIVYMSEVNFGRDQLALLETSPCYLANIRNPVCGGS